MKISVRRAMRAGVIAAFASMAQLASAESCLDYVQDHLIAQYDAYNNAGLGAHSSSPEVWKDLKGTHDLTPMNGVAFADAEVQVRCGTVVSGTGIQYLINADFHEIGDAVINGACTLEISFNSPGWPANDAGLFAHGCRFFSVWSNAGYLYRGLQFCDGVGGDGVARSYWSASKEEDHTVVFVVDGETLKVYQDGVYVGERTAGGNDRRSSYALTIGAQNPNDPDSTWAVSCDFNFKAVRIYDAVLTPEQIKANYDVDVERFVNGNEELVVGDLPGLLVASDVDGVPAIGADPTFGFYLAQEGSGVYTVRRYVRGADGHVYRCLGYSLAEKNDGSWGVEEEHLGEFAYTYAPGSEEEKMMRLTWRWELASDMEAKFMSFRSLTVVNADALASGDTDEAELQFGADLARREATVKDALYLAYGGFDYEGNDFAQYENLVCLGEVPVGTTVGTYKLPAGFGSDYRRIRFFLLTKPLALIDLYANDQFLSEWDALYNAGREVENATNPEVWKDLKGTHDLTPVGGVTFAENEVQVHRGEVYSGVNIQRLKTDTYPEIPAAVNAGACTIELRFNTLCWGRDSGLFAFGCRFFSHWASDSDGFYCGICFRDKIGGSVRSLPSINDQLDHTLAYVVEGNTLTVYNDGVQIHQRQAGIRGGLSNVPDADYLTIGSQNPEVGESAGWPAVSSDFNFKSIRIYNQSLSAAQVKSNYEVDNLRFGEEAVRSNMLFCAGEIIDAKPRGDWFYDADVGKISRAGTDWVLEVEPRDGTTLAVIGCVGNNVAPLDLACRIVDRDGIVWSIVEIADDAFNDVGAFDVERHGGIGADATHHVLVKLPSTLKRIGARAFYRATYMELDEILPESVVEVGDYAFSACSSLVGDLVIGDAGQEVRLGSYAFGIDNGIKDDRNLTMNLSSIHLGDGVKVIPEGCFRRNVAATEVELPETLESIGASAFDGDQLAWVYPTFPAAITNIGAYAFYGCHSMSNAIEVGTAGVLVTLGACAFAESSDTVSQMTYPSIVLGEGVTEIPDYLCYFNANALTNISFTMSVKSIGYFAFDSEHQVRDMVYDLGEHTMLADAAFRYYQPSVTQPNTYRFHGFDETYETKNVFGNADGTKLCAYLPNFSTEWLAMIADKVTPWVDCDQEAYKELFPNNRRQPIGQLTEAVGCLPSGTWIVLWIPPERAGLIILYH